MHPRRAELHLHGPTLAARLPHEEDAPALERVGAAGDALWPAWLLGDEPPPSWEWRIGELAAERAAGHRIDLLIVDRDGAPAGAGTLTDLSAQDGRATATLWLADATRAAAADGAARECVALLAQLAFGSLGLVRLGAQVPARDRDVLGALAHAGFVAETTLRSWWRHDDAAVDAAGLALLVAEWQPRPAITVHGPIPSGIAAALGCAGTAR
jgi:RimJ/RimL family protein N-acetyltransferase